MAEYKNVTNFPAIIPTHEVPDAEKEIVERTMVHRVDGVPRVIQDVVEVVGSITVPPGGTIEPSPALEKCTTFQNFVTARTLRIVTLATLQRENPHNGEHRI